MTCGKYRIFPPLFLTPKRSQPSLSPRRSSTKDPMSSNYKNSAMPASLLILLALGFAAIVAPKSTGESGRWPNVSHSEKPEPRRFGDGSDVFIATLPPAPDLEVTVNDTPHLVNFGNNLTYTITVKNIGELAATGVTLTDSIPAGASLVSANSTAGSCSGTTSINCSIGTLSGGTIATVTIVVMPPAVSFIHNTATATLNEIDATPTNNTVTTESIVIFADLALTKKAAQNLVAPGRTLTFSLIVRNKGGVPIDVSVTDQLPDGMTLINCTATGNGTCGGTASLLSIDFPQIAATATETILLTVRVSPSATEGTVISNTAIVTSSVPDPDFADNTSTASVTVAAVPILQKSNGIIAFDREFPRSPRNRVVFIP